MKAKLSIVLLTLFCVFSIGIFAIPKNTINAEQIAQPKDVATVQNNKESYSYVDMDSLSEDELTDVKYISNSLYFLKNPLHAEQVKEYNSKGTCTTVAMQMLLGYHNYYSDRRLIPKYSSSGVAFLSDNFGDPVSRMGLAEVARGNDQGKDYLGTQDSLYNELYSLTILGEFPGLGQSVYNVTDAAKKFIDKYALAIKDNIFIEASTYSESQAKAEIDAGRPILLGFNPIFSDADTFHVMVVYGYATVNGEFGYIVHYGFWGEYSHGWVPADCIGFQVRMNVTHNHTVNIDTGNNLQEKYACVTYREIACECGYSEVEDLYSTDDSGHTITGVNYPLINEVQIPESIHGKEITAVGDGAFKGQAVVSLEFPFYVRKIGDGAFEDCTYLTDLKTTQYITAIGKNAFRRCKLKTISFSGLKTLGDGAFAGNSDADIYVSESSERFYAENNILYTKDKTTILHTGHIDNVITVPETVTTVATMAFDGNTNLQSIRFKSAVTIESDAFKDCNNLRYVYFDSFAPSTAENNAFKNDGIIKIYVPYNAQEDYKTSLGEYSYLVDSIPVKIYFKVDDQTVETLSTFNGATVDGLPVPEIFGHNFIAWYDNREFAGTPWSAGDIINSEVDIILYAKKEAQDCIVVFHENGGVLTGNSSVTVKFGETFTTDTRATKEGNVLDGWFGDDGFEYVNVKGESTIKWNKPGITHITARWSIESYEIQINDDGTITWLSKDGLSYEQCTIEYGTVLSAINFIYIFKNSDRGFKTGKVFSHFECDNPKFNFDEIDDLGENGIKVTLKPIRYSELHYIHFHTQNGDAIPTIVEYYGEKISLPNHNQTGYVFDGWSLSVNGNDYVTWTEMPDLTPEDQNNGSVDLYECRHEIQYHITYNPNGGTGTTYSNMNVNYTQRLALNRNAYTKTGHDFKGWALSQNGSVVYTDGQTVEKLSSVQDAYVTLYAVWQAKIYNIICKNLITPLTVDVDWYRYGEGLSVMPKIGVMSSPGHFVAEDAFYGWYYNSSFTGNKITSISKTSTGNIVIYAKYDYEELSISDSGPCIITDAGVNRNPSIDIGIYLGSYRYNEIKDSTLKTIKIDIKLKISEIDDGYQHLYLYDKTSGAQVWHAKEDHVGGENTYSFRIELSIDEYKNTNHFVLKFDASGAWDDDWQYRDLNITVTFTN